MKSGDKPAAAHFVLLIKLELLLHIFVIVKNKVKLSETCAICGLVSRQAFLYVVAGFPPFQGFDDGQGEIHDGAGGT